MAQNQNSGEDNTGFFDEEGKKAEESEKREKIQDKKTEATKTKPESEENNQELDPYSEIDNASEDFITALEEELKKEESEEETNNNLFLEISTGVNFDSNTLRLGKLYSEDKVTSVFSSTEFFISHDLFKKDFYNFNFDYLFSQSQPLVIIHQSSYTLEEFQFQDHNFSAMIEMEFNRFSIEFGYEPNFSFVGFLDITLLSNSHGLPFGLSYLVNEKLSFAFNGIKEWLNIKSSGNEYSGNYQNLSFSFDWVNDWPMEDCMVSALFFWDFSDLPDYNPNSENIDLLPREYIYQSLGTGFSFDFSLTERNSLVFDYQYVQKKFIKDFWENTESQMTRKDFGQKLSLNHFYFFKSNFYIQSMAQIYFNRTELDSTENSAYSFTQYYFNIALTYAPSFKIFN